MNQHNSYGMSDSIEYELPSQEMRHALDGWSGWIEYPIGLPRNADEKVDQEYDLLAYYMGRGFVSPNDAFAWWILERGVRKYILSKGQDPDEYILKDWEDIDWNRFA